MSPLSTAVSLSSRLDATQITALGIFCYLFIYLARIKSGCADCCVLFIFLMSFNNQKLLLLSGFAFYTNGESVRLVALVERLYSTDIRLLQSSPRTPDATQAQLVLLQSICELFIPLLLFKVERVKSSFHQ